MKAIEPFNKVWLDCYNNLKLSLLNSVDLKYELRGYENSYEYYYISEAAGSGYIVNCITEGQDYIEYEEFSEIEKLNPDTEEDLLKIVVNQLKKKNGFVLMRIDLYDWMEGSVCWHNYHWEHYSLLVDYDEENDMIIAFDEAGGHYKKLQVRRDHLYRHLSPNQEFEKIQLITMKDTLELHPISWRKIVNNAKEIVSSIEELEGKEFWYMQQSDYEEFWYMDLNGVFLQKIEGRQNANSLLMKTLSCTNMELSIELFDKWKRIFEGLSSDWTKIRMALFLIYRKEKKRAEKLIEINEMVQKCLLTEKKLWEEFIRSIEGMKNLDSNAIY